MPIKEKTKWKKVSQIKIGEFIAVPKNSALNRRGVATADVKHRSNDILWDEIVSIKPVGREQVYDIEIEDTHNFVGNDIFAHNTYLGGNVGIGAAAPVARLQVNEAETAFVVTSDGRVGVGTTTPSYQLSVAGDIAATAFVNISTRNAKIDIRYLTGEEEKNILEKIKEAKVAEYHYGAENLSNPKRLGLIAEEAPAEVLSIDGKGVDIYKLSSFILAGVKAQQIEIENIKGDVAFIKSEILSTKSETNSNDSNSNFSVAQLPNYLITVAKSALSSVLATIGDWANAVLAEETKLEVASEDATNVSYKTYGVTAAGEEMMVSGSATLVMGSDAVSGARFARAKIKFDESFIAAIGENAQIKVIITPTTRLNGPVYVHAKSRFGFEVREMNAQDEGGMFDWLVIARKRATDANIRMDANDTNATTNILVTPVTPVAPVIEPISPIGPTENLPVEEPITPPVPIPSEQSSSTESSILDLPSPSEESGGQIGTEEVILPVEEAAAEPVTEEVTPAASEPATEEVVAPVAEGVPAETPAEAPAAEEPAPAEVPTP